MGITFPNRQPAEFLREVKEQVDLYFRENKLSTKANGAMKLKTLLLLTWTIGCYLLLLCGSCSGPVSIVWAIFLGVGLAGVGFSVSHDALHGAYSQHDWVNLGLGMTSDLMGVNSYLWKLTHNIIHHTYTNIHGLDEDLSVSPFLRLSPHASLRTIHRWQHLYALPLYSFSTLFWVFVKDYRYFLQRDLGPYKNIQHPTGELAFLLLSKAFYYTWAWIVPLLVLPFAWWQTLLGLVLTNLVAGFLLGIVFQLAHVVEDTQHPEPQADGTMAQAWLVHEMETTSDFARGNGWLSWYIGGLNFQIEHHLFPRICSVHYPAISPIVEAVARKHGIAFHDQPTFRAALASHYRTLRRHGLEAFGAGVSV